MNPGELRERLIIQSFIQNGSIYSWNGNEGYKLWTKKEIENKKCVYSSHGQAADLTTKFVVRYNKNITKHNAILHDGRHYAIASILDIENKHCLLEINAAQVTPKICEVKKRTGELDELNRPLKELATLKIFSAYLTEKYIKFSAEYFANVAELYILITPKDIQLDVSNLVVIDNVKYNIQAAHITDEYRNEYEIAVNKEA